jgi:hypothetical protein
MQTTSGYAGAGGSTGRRRWGRTMAGIAATAVILVSGCGSGSDNAGTGGSGTGGSGTGSTGGGGSGSSSESGTLAYAKCMRTEGIADFPDPNASGKLEINGNKLDTNSAQFKAAHEKCKSMLPQGGQPPGPPPAEVGAAQLNYAKCMRENGVTKFPDPNAEGGIDINGDTLGVDPGGPVFKAADDKCKHFLEEVATGPRIDTNPGGPGDR